MSENPVVTEDLEPSHLMQRNADKCNFVPTLTFPYVRNEKLPLAFESIVTGSCPLKFLLYYSVLRDADYTKEGTTVKYDRTERSIL